MWALCLVFFSLSLTDMFCSQIISTVALIILSLVLADLISNLTNNHIDNQIKLLANGLKERFNIKDCKSDKNNYSNKIVRGDNKYWLITSNYKRLLTLKNTNIKTNNINTVPIQYINRIPNYNDKNTKRKIKNLKASDRDRRFFKTNIINENESECLINIYNNRNLNST